MSSAYYAKLKSGAAVAAEVDIAETEDGFDAADVFGDLAGNLSPVRSAAKGSSGGGGKPAHPDLEARSQKTAAAVDQMRDRLLAMGILQGAEPAPASPAPTASQEEAGAVVRNVNARSLKLAAATNIRARHSGEGAPAEEPHFMPPPPPYAGDADANALKTAAAVDSMRESLRDMGLLGPDGGDDNDTESTASGGEVGQEIDGDVQAALADKTKEASNLLKYVTDNNNSFNVVNFLRHPVCCNSNRE